MKSTKLEKLSHYAIIVIALSALVVSVMQTRIQHNHNKLTVKPYLHHSLDQNFDDDLVTVYIVNDGFGPAIVEQITFTYKDKTYYSLEDYLNASGEIKNRRNSYNYGKNSVFKSNQKNLIFKLNRLQERHVKVDIKFKSIYDEEGSYSFIF
jgi:hypothetical protein